MSPRIEAVSVSPLHGFSKQPQGSIRLLAGEGVEGDAHCGRTTQHLYRMRKDSTQPNLCQVHLLGCERLADFAAGGFHVAAGEFGENVLTTGVDLHALPLGTVLRLGTEAVVQVTGERTPCSQIDGLCQGLQALCWGPRGTDGKRSRRAGIMGVVLVSGEVWAGDAIVVELPEGPHGQLPAV